MFKIVLKYSMLVENVRYIGRPTGQETIAIEVIVHYSRLVREGMPEHQAGQEGEGEGGTRAFTVVSLGGTG